MAEISEPAAGTPTAVHFYPGSGIYAGFTSCGTRGRVTADPLQVTCEPCIAEERSRGIPWPLTHAEYVAAVSVRSRRLAAAGTSLSA